MFKIGDRIRRKFSPCNATLEGYGYGLVVATIVRTEGNQNRRYNEAHKAFHGKGGEWEKSDYKGGNFPDVPFYPIEPTEDIHGIIIQFWPSWIKETAWEGSFHFKELELVSDEQWAIWEATTEHDDATGWEWPEIDSTAKREAFEYPMRVAASKKL